MDLQEACVSAITLRTCIHGSHLCDYNNRLKPSLVNKVRNFGNIYTFGIAQMLAVIVFVMWCTTIACTITKEGI